MNTRDLLLLHLVAWLPCISTFTQGDKWNIITVESILIHSLDFTAIFLSTHTRKQLTRKGGGKDENKKKKTFLPLVCVSMFSFQSQGYMIHFYSNVRTFKHEGHIDSLTSRNKELFGDLKTFTSLLYTA